MSNREARAIAAKPSEVVLGDHQIQRLAQLASRVTACPLQITSAENGELAEVAGSELAFLEVVGVIAAFNFITRMADALGVDPEIWTWVQQTPPMRNVVSRVMALGLRGIMGLRGAVDLQPRNYSGEEVDQDLALLEKLYHGLGLGPLPDFFRRLRTVPHLLRSEREFFEAIAEVHGANPGRFIAAGRIVLEEVSHSTLRSLIDAWLHPSGDGLPDRLLDTAIANGATSKDLVPEMKGFAKDMTLNPSSITRERVQKLRSCGLTDELILDWAFAVALWNAIGRTERLLECEP
jgi:alkylhydroperoxidase family enzyme